jgi:signal transduction histidine kinase
MSVTMTETRTPVGTWQTTAFKVAGVYILIAILWIAFSDRLLAQLIQDPAQLSRGQTLKGWLFVMTTGGLLFVYLQRSLRREQKAFEELTTLFQSLPAIVYAADMQSFELLFVNGYASERFGRNWRGQNCYAYLQQGQEQPCGFCSNPLLLRDGRPGPPVTWEFRNTRDGRWYQCLDKAVRWPNGRLVRLEIALDITERKEMERTRDELLATVSHEMLTPLTAISGFAELLLEERSLTGPARRHVDTICRETEKMQELIQTFLELKRLKTDRTRVGYERLALRDLLEQCATNCPDCDGRHAMAIDCPGELEVFGNRRELTQVFRQLFDNACRFSPAGGTVAVQAGAADGNVQVLIIDEGIGIPAEEQERIFEPFHRLDIGDRRRARGIGLGLAMVREIITLHGGSIRVESAAGQGSRFAVILPTPEATVAGS